VKEKCVTIRIHSRFVWRCGFILAVAFLQLAGARPAGAQGCTGVSTSTTGAVTWTPQWCQEFNGTTVSPPDPTVWKFDLGNNNGWGNSEVEVYCGPPQYANNPSQCPTMLSGSADTVYIDGSGHLVIQPINIKGTWISTRMSTQGLENFQYGRIEASLQLPDTTNQGLWPAFWSLGSNIATVPWPACGEADIMEVWSPSVLSGPGPTGNRSTLHTALTDGAGVQPNGSFTFTSPQTNSSAFHTYGVIWSANIQQYYTDNPLQPYYIATPSDLKPGDIWPFNLKFFLLMNVAVGGTLGGSAANLVNPQPLMADYVRQYSPSTVAKPTLGNPPSITVKAGATTGNFTTLTPGLTPGTGFVYFSCSTTAPKTSCSVATTDPLNTHTVNSSPSGAAESATVRVVTTANSVLPPIFFNPKMRLWLPIVIVELLVSMVVALARRTRSRALLCGCTVFAGLIFAGAVIAGCGATSSVTIPPPPNTGTPPGSYAVTVYAFTESNASDGSNGNADASVAIPLTVN
jgi:beta-glucanase (GH16 family)